MRCIHWLAPLILTSIGFAAHAAEVSLIGVFPGKAAVLSLDGGAPKTVRVGATWSGITVVSVERAHAVVSVDGTQRRLALGQYRRGDSDERQRASLAADARGHFLTQGMVNGAPVRFLVDTGATMISLPAQDAQRLGLDYRKGRIGQATTANGRVTAWQVRLDTVRVGEIELHQVDAIVIETGLDIALLGMSFLNRVEMRREGYTMTLMKRY